MFIVVQHPFADLRAFVAGPTGRLERPAWPLVDPNIDFVRSSGLVRARLRGGLSEWAGEEAYSDAARAIRFPNRLGDIKLGAEELQGHARFCFRRFHSAGKVARVEAGFRIDLAMADTVRPSVESCRKLVDHCVTLPTTVRGSDGKPKQLALVATGRNLALHYLLASTSRKAGVQPIDWWFQAGTPALVIEGAAALGELAFLPFSQVVFDDPKVGVLRHAWVDFGPHRCSTWGLIAAENGVRADVRRLRMHLLRFHAEMECLRLVLRAVDSGKLSIKGGLSVSDEVQQYLNDVIGLVERNERNGFTQSAMFEAAQQATGLALGSASTTYRIMRRQIAVKVDRNIQRAEATAQIINNFSGDQVNNTIKLGNVNVTGDFNFVTAKNISNSFTKVASADVKSELKEALQGLTVKVAELVKELPPEQAETASKDLEALTSEAVSKKPRKEWYDLSADGLLSAAKAVAGMAAPVTAAVKAVLALLA